LLVANSQQAVNHTCRWVRVRSKIVPAVTDVRRPHRLHMNRVSASRQPWSWLHPGQLKPFGQRSHSR
jgi:hypothetical protein